MKKFWNKLINNIEEIKCNLFLRRYQPGDIFIHPVYVGVSRRWIAQVIRVFYNKSSNNWYILFVTGDSIEGKVWRLGQFSVLFGKRKSDHIDINTTNLEEYIKKHYPKI